MRNHKPPNEAAAAEMLLLRGRRKKPMKIKMILTKGLLLVLLPTLLLANVKAQEEGEKIDLATYNAQLLDTLGAEQFAETFASDETNSSAEDSVLGFSVESSTSSAISYEPEATTAMPPRPRSDKSSQTSWGGFEDSVPVNDPELDAVFPQFAEAYNQEEGQLQADLSDLDFVDQSDFAILNEDGSIESYGSADELEDVIYENYENFDEYEQEVEEYPDQPLEFAQVGGPTTLMLFNIFTPEEVDFLTTLVGEDAVKELKDDVDIPNVQGDDFRQTLEFSTPKSRRPPQFEEDPKNAYPSSQGIVRPDSSIRESLEVYYKSELQHEDQAGDLEEEGDYVDLSEVEEFAKPSEPVERAASLKRYGPSSESQESSGLIAKAEDRRKKMEALLEKLSERFETRNGENNGQKSEEDALDEEIKETDEKTDKMKMMIENLKHKLANSRPGVNTIDTKTLDEPIPVQNNENERQYYHTTAPPVHIDKVSEMIGEKLRDMQTGIHTLDLDDMLDLDNIQIKNKGEKTEHPQYPIPPPGAETKPKRQVIHPKLTKQRPIIGKAHIPSINLKSYITPATEAPNLAAVEYNQRPIIPRYIDEAIPTPQPYAAYQSPDDAKPKVKYLPPRIGPRLQGYKRKEEDPYPETKELPPAFSYSTTEYPVFDYGDEPYEDKTEKIDHLPPPIFYSDRHVPDNFDPKQGPHPVPPKTDTLPHLEPGSVKEYVSSNSYRSKDDQHQAGRSSKEYAPAAHYFPPPSYNYKQPNIRFDETPTKAPHIQVTPKNVPLTTSLPSGLSSTYTTPGPDYVQSLPTKEPKPLPPRSYAPPPYRPPSYDTKGPDHLHPPSKEYNNPKNEHISSLSPPARGYVPPVGHRAVQPPPQKPYHSPRPSYMSKIYPPRSGYVPPSSGNYVSTLSPPSHGYSTPLPHVSSISPPRKNYLPPKAATKSPEKTYSTPKPSYVSSIAPPKYGYSTPPPYHTMSPPKESYGNPVKSYISTMSPPQKGYDSHLSTMGPPSGLYEAPDYMSTMKPPANHYESPSYMSTMKPPSNHYKAPSYMSTIKPPVHYYEKPIHNSMTEMKPPSESYESGIQKHLSKIPPPPKDSYLPPDPSMTKYTPPTGDFSALQPNYREAMKPPKASYEEGLKSIMAKLSLPEQEFLEHAMSGKTYLPPKEEYKAPDKLKEHKPPSKDYIDTMFKYLEDMKAPTKDYLPPKENYMKPPAESYEAAIAEMLSSMHLPRKGYLPPDDVKKPTSYEPPSKGYKDPMAEYLGAFHAPETGYLPPKSKGVHMQPPSSSYEHPLTDYMTKLQVPDKGYLPPKGVTGLLPELASYLSPISEYMASMIPPKTEYSYKETIKPPTSDYLPPEGSKLKPPSGEYLTPFKPKDNGYKDPRLLSILPPTDGYNAPPQPRPRPPIFSRTVCPPASKDVKCEYVKHQCWSHGVPDQDCPGNGLCCFNGCVNICLPPPSSGFPIVSNFHIPPNKAYLVPGQENLYLGALASKRRNEEGSDALSEHFLPPMYSLAALDTIEISGLPDRPTVSQLPREQPEKANMMPPSKEYLPPPPRDYPVPVDGYTLPNYEGTDILDIQRPLTKYPPKSLGYQVSHEQVAFENGLQLPGKEYLPPVKISQYQPPASDYKAPKKIEAFVPPTSDYIPPDGMTKYKPPSNGYVAPASITDYKPPSKEYIPPKADLKPPNHEYLPPPSTTLNPVTFTKEELDAFFHPPSDSYKNPQATFSPPSSDYIPPSLAVFDPYKGVKSSGAHFIPPSQEYLAPHAPVEDTLLEGVPFKVPIKEYIPPHLEEHASITPPLEDYLTPLHGEVPPPAGAHFAPPSKEYLVPLHGKPHPTITPHPVVHHEHGKLVPPVKEYIPPGGGHPHNVPHPDHAVFHPPSKEYLPPKTVIRPDGTTFKPPATDYASPPVTPHIVDHVGHVHNIDMTYKPPTKDYLPPHDDKLPPPPHPKDIPHDDLPTLVPPSKEYLPPPSNAIEEIGHAIHIAEHHEAHVTVPPALLPKPGTPDYHITATLHKDGHVEPHHGIVSKVGPHSINIQINIPDSKKNPNYKEGLPTLFRTSKPPSYSGKAPDIIHHPKEEELKEGYHKMMPHMLPHDHHSGYKVMPHMLPHEEHKGYEPGGPPPTLPQYVPPPMSTTYDDGYYKMPKYLQTDYHLPPKEYLPSHHRLPPREYLPTNPQIYNEGYRKPSYESKVPDKFNEDLLLNPMQTLKPPLEEFSAPSELKAPIKADGYIPPERATLKPPDKDYLPPPGKKDDYLPPPEREPLIPDPPSPEEIPTDVDDGLSSRGPQFVGLQQKEKEYVRPPPRPDALDPVIEDVLNSQVNPPFEGKEMYIPRKTEFDVPKNFIRPDDLLRAPPADIIIDPDDEVDEFGFDSIDILDADNLPEPPLPESVPEQLTEQPFLGLAKLIDPERKKSLKELEDLRAEVKKLAKLVEKPKGPQLPPIPTVPSLLNLQQLQKLPPQPSSFMPFIEKLEPSVLQQLQSTVRSQNTRDGKIPGKPGVDYPDFKTIPATDFSCENFLLEGFYADTFTSCQVFHVCESGKRQSSFLCPKGTIFNQKHRVCDWWYNVKCEDATEFYDLNLDLILLDKGVSPTQATSLNVPPPIDPLSSLGNDIDSGLLSENLPLELLAGSDAELDSLILDDLVLSNLLGKRRMDNGDDLEDSQFLSDVIDVTVSPITRRLPTSVAAPIQPQPPRRRRKKKRDRKKKKNKSGGGGSLCQIIGICDSVPSATQEQPIKSQNSPQSDVPFAASQMKPLYIEAPKEKRLGEKTAAEIAQLFLQDEPQRPEQLEDSQFAASSITNTVSFPHLPLEHSYDPEETPTEIDFAEGQKIKLIDDIPEGHRMTHFNKDVTQLEDFLNVPIASINFEDYKERESRMVPESNDSDEISNDDQEDKQDFKLEDYNVDRESRTWRPLKLNKSGEVKRTDVSETQDESDWVPKLGPNVKVRET